jgi:hypothetical protein
VRRLRGSPSTEDDREHDPTGQAGPEACRLNWHRTGCSVSNQLATGPECGTQDGE